MSTIVLEHLQHANSASPDLTVDSSGRIGIGTTTPSATVEINPGSGSSELKITSTDNGGNNLRLIQGYNTYLNASNNVYMSAGGNTDMFNLVNGRVGIGNTGPSSPLEVHSSVTDAYTPADYNNVPIITLKSPNTVDNYTGIRYSNSAGNYEWYVGSHQKAGAAADFVIQGFDRTNSGYKEHIRVHDTGQVSMPYTPSFSATGLSAHRYMDTWHNVDLNNWNVVDQSSANAYNNSTGRFTAPVTGMYFFIYTSMFQNPNSNDFHNILKKNGTVIVNSNNHSGGGSTNGHTWNDCTASAAVYLQAGDYVTCCSTGSNSSTCFLYGSGTASRYSNFSGWLIG